MKDKWKIPEVIEREYLRPIADELVLPYYKQYGEENVWIQVEASASREEPKDKIIINILNKNKKDVDQVIIEIDDFNEETLNRFEDGSDDFDMFSDEPPKDDEDDN